MSITGTNANENGNKGTINFTRTGGTTAALTVNYTVSGTAIPGTDYQTLPGSITFGVRSGHGYAACDRHRQQHDHRQHDRPS